MEREGRLADTTVQPDMCLSADVEADGPIQGPYSMLSFGLAVADTVDGTPALVDPTERTFYRELRLSRAVQRFMPPHPFSRRPHTHHALDDAVEQAELLVNLLRWRPGE
jgi:hypothetical protein